MSPSSRPARLSLAQEWRHPRWEQGKPWAFLEPWNPDSHQRMAGTVRGAEKGHASAMGLRAVGASTPSPVGLASPGPRLSQSPSCCLQCYLLTHKNSLAPHFLQSAAGWSRASLNISLPRPSPLCYVMPQLKSLPGFSPHLCPHPGTMAPHQIAHSSSNRLFQALASAQATPSI